MKRILLGAVVVLGLGVNGNAQQDPQYSQFMYDKVSVNPGAAGIHGMYCGTVMYRNQWMGFDGSPKTVLLNLDGSLDMLHGGVGLTFYNDRLGFETNNIIRASYSYHWASPIGLVGIGASLGYAGKSFSADWQYIDANDGVIPGNNVSEGAFDANFGVYWKSLTGNSYAGISSTHINGASLDDLNLDIARHFWLMGGHKHDFGQWAVSGDFIVQSDFASTQWDIAARGWYQNTVYAGASYRHKDAVYPMVGYHKQLPSPEGSCSKMFVTTGLAYDVTLSDLSNYSNGSLELFVKFCFKPCIVPVLPRPIDVRFLGT